MESISQWRGRMQLGPNIFTTKPVSGIPAAIPIIPPIIAKAMYLAANSHLKLRESTP